MSEDFSRGLIKYTSRDYNSLLSDIKKLVPTLTELWKPEAEADPGLVILKVLASVADMLGVNLDLVASEMFAPSVKQRKNAEKIFSLIGYELGWYRAARTEVTFTNNTPNSMKIDFGFNGANFCTLNAYTDITNEARVITYNILPCTNKYGATETRSRRQVLTDALNVFAESDIVTLRPGESVTRVAIEGELRSADFSVETIKNNKYVVKLPSQHLDTTAIWIRAKNGSGEYIDTQWIQCSSPAEFIEPEPRFAVTYDTYSNAQIQISNYLNQLENYDGNALTIYWIDCSGIIGCVGEDVLQDFLPAKSQHSTFSSASGDITLSNLSNTVELPHTHSVTGQSPETAKEAYRNSRNYINTFDSLCTVPDFNRFLNREPGVDCGVVLDCEKALDINMAIYNDQNLTDSQKSKMYITKYDFPEGDLNIDWKEVLGLGFNPSDPQRFVFSTNFKTYTAMCFAVHNDFKDSSWGNNQIDPVQIINGTKFYRYKPPQMFIDNVIRDYRPLNTMSAKLEFGYLRIFPFYVVGTIRTTKPVDKSNADNIIASVREALSIYFSPANREIGVKPTISEIIEVVEGADSRIRHFDPGSAKTPGIVWTKCDEEYFNAISFARYSPPSSATLNIRIDPTCIQT